MSVIRMLNIPEKMITGGCLHQELFYALYWLYWLSTDCFYFYHAGDRVKQWWLNGGSAKFGLKPDKAGNTTVNSVPVPPPRARKHATIGFLGVPDNLV